MACLSFHGREVTPGLGRTVTTTLVDSFVVSAARRAGEVADHLVTARKREKNIPIYQTFISLFR